MCESGDRVGEKGIREDLWWPVYPQQQHYHQQESGCRSKSLWGSEWLRGASKRPALELLSVSQRAVLTRSVRLFVCQGRLERPDLLRHNLELASVFEEKLCPGGRIPTVIAFSSSGEGT